MLPSVIGNAAYVDTKTFSESCPSRQQQWMEVSQIYDKKQNIAQRVVVITGRVTQVSASMFEIATKRRATLGAWMSAKQRRHEPRVTVAEAGYAVGTPELMKRALCGVRVVILRRGSRSQYKCTCWSKRQQPQSDEGGTTGTIDAGDGACGKQRRLLQTVR